MSTLKSLTWQPFTSSRRGFPTCNTYTRIHPSSESSLNQSFTRCTRRSIKLKRRLQQLRFSWCLRVTLVYRAHKTRHVTSTIQTLIKGMQRTGLNRHRRGYATKEAGSASVGSYWACPVSILNYQYFIIINIISLSIISFKKILYSRVSEALDFYRFYSTKQGIRSYIYQLSGIFKGLIKTILPHASRYQAIPMNLMYMYK